MTNIITRSEAEALIAATKGKMFSVVFTKRTDGSTRKMTARLGVKSALRGGDAAYDASKKGLVVVYDITKRDYRAIPTDALTALNCGGKRYEVR
jgi:hypothetical protein